MAFFKKLGFFGAPLLVMAAGALAVQGCDGGVCGPCGDVVKGDVGISGNAKLDGFFAAVSQLNTATVTASADFEGGLRNLEAAFGLKAEGNIEARVDDLIAAIKADFSATLDAEAGLQVTIAPAKCTANVDVAFEAQASCEAKAECDVKAKPPSVSVECKGECTGSCEGSCEASASATCEVSSGGVACEGSCEGTCEMEAGATCEGTCHGECEGTCSVKNADGQCAGSCEGKCKGNCELKASAKCEGKCTGSCKVEAPEGKCEGEASLKCEGGCKGECSGGCTGEATPPEASANCEASADCKAQAKAQGSASLTCTPPSIEIGYKFAAGIDADAQASFIAKLGALKANGAVMVQSFTKYQALIDGKVNGEVAFKPSPLASVSAELKGVIDAGIEGELFADIPAGRIDCVIPALQSSVTLLGDIGTEAKATLSAQAKFFAAFSGGFKS